MAAYYLVFGTLFAVSLLLVFAWIYRWIVETDKRLAALEAEQQ